MDIRRAFLSTARTLLQALVELSHYRIVGQTVRIAVLSVNVIDKDLYDSLSLPVVSSLKKVRPHEFNSFGILFQESSIIISYSWLDTFLSELEEALFLHDPASLGESVQVKLGKILSSPDIDSLVHDIAKKKTREKGGWSLKNRVVELRETYKLKLTVTDQDLEWLGDLRNNLVHNRRIGEFKTNKGKLEYGSIERRQVKNDEQLQRFLSLVFTLLAQLYQEGAKTIRITGRFSQHRTNMQLIKNLALAYPPSVT